MQGTMVIGRSKAGGHAREQLRHGKEVAAAVGRKARRRTGGGRRAGRRKGDGGAVLEGVLVAVGNDKGGARA